MAGYLVEDCERSDEVKKRTVEMFKRTHSKPDYPEFSPIDETCGFCHEPFKECNCSGDHFRESFLK